MELSAFQNIWHDTQEYVAGILNQDDVLREMGVVFLCENARDVEYEVKKALQKTGMFAVVMTPRAIYQGNAQGVTQAWTLEDLQLQIVENPPVHRAWMKKRGHTKGTGLDVARQASERLAGPQGGHYGQFTTKTMEEAEREGLVVTTVSFGATVFEDYLSAFPSCDVSGSWSLVPFVRMSDLSDWLEEYLSCEWNRLSNYMPLDMSGDMNIRMSGHKLSIGGDPAVPGDITPLVVDDMYGMVVTWQLSSSNGIFGPYTMMKPAGGQTGLKLWNSYILDGTPGDSGNYLGNVLQGLSDQISGQGASLSDYYKKTETSSAAQISSGFDRLSAYYEKTETSSAAQISSAFANLDPLPWNLKDKDAELISLSGEWDESEGGGTFSYWLCGARDKKPFTLRNIGSEDGQVKLFNVSDQEEVLSGGEWIPYTAAQTVDVPAGGEVSFRRRRVPGAFDALNIGCGLTGQFAAAGYIASLVRRDFALSNEVSSQGAFAYMFTEQSGLVDAFDLRLPEGVIPLECFDAAMSGCVNLSAGPRTIGPGRVRARSFRHFCDGCSSLLNCPELDITGAGEDAFLYAWRSTRVLSVADLPQDMAVGKGAFSAAWARNDDLKTAPALPFQSAERSYSYTFAYCHSLTSTPPVVLTNLDKSILVEAFRNTGLLSVELQTPYPDAYRCLFTAFDGCSALNRIKVNWTGDWPAQNQALSYWVRGVSSNGTFECYPTLDTSVRGQHGVPSNWTVDTILT